MNFTEFATEDSIVLDYERAAKEIFPLLANAPTSFLKEQYAIAFGNILGNPGEFFNYVSGSEGDKKQKIRDLGKHFKQNIELLVGKTWVDHSDSKKKSKILGELALFNDSFFADNIPDAHKRFIKLSEDVAHLLFGDLASQDDFIEYSFRIDPHFGLFSWFIMKIKKLEKLTEEDAHLHILLGMYFLATF